MHVNKQTEKWLKHRFGEQILDDLKEMKLGIPEPFEFKQADKGGFYIEGYASTKSKDRGGNIVLPEAFEKAMQDYMTNPINFYMHDWCTEPVGKVVDHRIDDRGLWVKIYVSETADKIRKLIEEDILKGLSIGYRPLTVEYQEKDTPDEIRIIKELILYEISIVNIPMNKETLFTQAKDIGINLETLILAPGGIPDAGAQAKESGMPPELKDVNPELKALQVKVDETNNRLKGLTDEVAGVTKLEPRLGQIISDLVKTNQESTAAFKEMIGKAYDNFFKRYDEKTADDEKKKAPRKLIWDDPSLLSVDMTNLKGAKIRDPYEFHVKVMNKDFHGLPDNQLRAFKELQLLNDRLYTAHWFGKMYGDPGFSIKGLQLYSDFNRLKNEFLKAMDTETAAEGLEWVAVGYSSRLFEKIQPELKVAGMFETLPMPMPSIHLPTDMSEDTGYLIPQNLHDVADKIRALTPPTSEVTLTCKKFGARIVVSTEMIEDSIVAILPRIERKLIRALARAIETSYINGDDTATHMDSNVTNSWDARKAYKGLRKYAKAASSETDLGTYNAEAVRNLRKGMVDYGVNPSDLVHIISLSEYINMLSLKDAAGNHVVSTLQAWGPDHTFRKGTLGIFDGSEIIVSPFVGTNLNASGVYDGVTMTKTVHITVNTEGFVGGERRITKVGEKDDIETDQKITVVTSRRGFVKVASSTLYPVWVGYNITP